MPPRQRLAVLRQGLKELPGQLDLEWNLAHLLAYQGQTDEAAEVVARLDKQGFPRTELEYLNARIHASPTKENWQIAAQILERIYPVLLGRADQHRDWLAISLVLESNLLLAKCYEQLGDLDASSSAYSRAVTRFPQSVVARIGFARTEWALGRFDSAVREYSILMQMPQAPGVTWIECAQLMIARTSADRSPIGPRSNGTSTSVQAEQLTPVPVEVGAAGGERC